MDYIFDIDGTLADATHRLRLIQDTNYFVSSFPGACDLKPNWDRFFSDEEMMKDTPITPICNVLSDIARSPWNNRVLFVTGRPERTRDVTVRWLVWMCDRFDAGRLHRQPTELISQRLYMRGDRDRRPSHQTKEDNLRQLRDDGYNPRMVFEDRAADTAMWRNHGLICAQVAEGTY